MSDKAKTAAAKEEASPPLRKCGQGGTCVRFERR